MLRPIVGIVLYAVAVFVGWFIHPGIAVFIFMLVVGFYAVTSRGVFVLGRKTAAQG